MLSDDVRVVSLDALDIILNLLLYVGLTDSHIKQVFYERFKLLILREWTIDAVFGFLSELLASLSDKDAVLSDFSFFVDNPARICNVILALTRSDPTRHALRSKQLDLQRLQFFLLSFQ